MTPEQRLEQAVRFMDMNGRAEAGEVLYSRLRSWLRGKDFAPEDAHAIARYVGRLMAEEAVDMVSTNLEQTGETV